MAAEPTNIHWRAEAAPNPTTAAGVETDLPTGVVTFMLTDIEGSTAMWEAHPEAMASALFRHDEIVARAVASANGRLIKSKGEGDSTLSVFSEAAGAAKAALCLQRAISEEPWPQGLVVKVRVAIHSGEAIQHDGDYYGGTVNRAARLRQLARGGDILCSGTTASLVSDSLPQGSSVVDMGEIRLRDFRSPERVFVIVHPANRAADADPYRGMLTTMLKLFAEAEEHFECAVRLARRTPAPPWEADACYQFALMLRARAGSGDACRAVELLAHARRIARRLGMPELDRAIEAATGLESTAATHAVL